MYHSTMTHPESAVYLLLMPIFARFSHTLAKVVNVRGVQRTRPPSPELPAGSNYLGIVRAGASAGRGSRNPRTRAHQPQEQGMPSRL
ncbi:hypothetical protein CSW53_16190 [Rhodococcus ruber]|nr:hypothetical protein CSW53_16190 [Rhodococcus ruber]